MDDNSTVVDDILVNDWPGRTTAVFFRSEKPPQENRLFMGTYIPTSQTMSEVSGDDKMRPRISQECMTVSPFSVDANVRNAIEILNDCKPSRKWSRHPYPLRVFIVLIVKYRGGGKWILARTVSLIQGRLEGMRRAVSQP